MLRLLETHTAGTSVAPKVVHTSQQADVTWVTVCQTALRPNSINRCGDEKSNHSMPPTSGRITTSATSDT